MKTKQECQPLYHDNWQKADGSMLTCYNMKNKNMYQPLYKNSVADFAFVSFMQMQANPPTPTHTQNTELLHAVAAGCVYIVNSFKVQHPSNLVFLSWFYTLISKPMLLQIIIHKPTNQISQPDQLLSNTVNSFLTFITLITSPLV